jgi:hypothetical protein
LVRVARRLSHRPVSAGSTSAKALLRGN